MIHAREDYQRRFPHDPALEDSALLSPGSTPIADDEPVCLFRAQDENFIGVLHDFDFRLEQSGIPETDPIRISVQAHIDRAIIWQQKHGCKKPDL